jgi:hypothetical protein
LLNELELTPISLPGIKSMTRFFKTRSLETDGAPDTVYGVLADPARIPEWAPRFADRMERDSDVSWRAFKSEREFPVRIASDPASRTMDILRRLPSGEETGAYLRVIARPGGGSLVLISAPAGVNPDQTGEVLRQELAAIATLSARIAG